MSAIKFLENISFDDDIEIQLGDPTSPDGIIKGNSQGLNLSTPVAGSLLKLECNGSSGFIGFGYGSTSYFFYMNSITGATEIRHSNSKVFETVSGGTKVTGSLQVTGTFKDSSGDTGTSGQVLSSTGSGTNWIASGGTPAGSNTQIQFNDSGSFGADADFTWDGTDLDIDGNVIGGNTSVLHMRQIKVDEQLASSSAGAFGKGSRLFYFGTQSLAPGRVYALTQSGWTQSSATTFNLLATGFLGVATSTASGAGLLVEGVVYLNTDPGGNLGDVIYLDTTAGVLTNDVSGFTTGDIVRVAGYKVGNNKVYFSPSQDWIEIS